jgi:transposase-like protein
MISSDSTHFILYSPPAGAGSNVKTTSKLPQFRKSIYTKEIKDFIIRRIRLKEMSMSEVINQYGIPKTTLHKWLKKQE